MVFIEKILVGELYQNYENYKWSIQRKKISHSNLKNTRPLRDYVRENIFNIIIHGKKLSLILIKKLF